MSVYIAPEIKDRVAVGDDLYQITDSGGKKKLTPSPTEVSEVGTAINKALLQPLANAVQRNSENLIPYTQYWWRTTTSSSGYLTKLVTLSKAGTSAYYSSGSSYYLKICLYDTSSSLQYSSNVSCDSSGNITLVSPSTYSLADGVPKYDWFRGKYIKGLYQNSDLIYYFSSSNTVYYPISSMQIGSEEYYAMYNFTIDGTAIQVVQAYQVTSNSEAQYISAESSDAYPHSGTTAGITYQYLGLISDFAPTLAPFSPFSQNFTSANFSDNNFKITIPYSRYFLVVQATLESVSGKAGCFGIVENGKFSGVYKMPAYNSSYSTWSYDQRYQINSDYLNLNKFTVNISTDGVNFSSSSGGNPGTYWYMPF